VFLLVDLVYHFVQVVFFGVVDKAVDYVIRAGDRMVDAFVYEEVVRFYDLALLALDLLLFGMAIER